jgi:hypothetical protein
MRKLILLTMIALAGCENGYREKSYPAIPPELKDCRFFYLSNSAGDSIQVARCPNSTTTTTYRSGKTTRSAVVIDGVEYVQKEQSHG